MYCDIRNNKFARLAFAESNLGRGPRRGAVAHVRRKVPVGYDEFNFQFNFSPCNLCTVS